MPLIAIKPNRELGPKFAGNPATQNRIAPKYFNVVKM